MPKDKNKGKEKEKSPDYPLVTLEENLVFQLKNDSLVQRVNNTASIIEEAETAVIKILEDRREHKDWLAYLACDHIPKPFQPNSIRRFLYKSFFYEEEDMALTTNWQLAIDELSILTQDIDAVDLSKNTLSAKKVDFGTKYDVRVNDIMMILSRILQFLKNPNVILSERMLIDIDQLKFVAYRQINNYIDNLTYRVLCSEEGYMDPVEVTMAEYAYSGQHFDIHIWTFKNVPIYLDPQDTPRKAVNLKRICTILTVPFSVLCENMVIRGLHCHFDHFSAHARYYQLSMAEQANPSLKAVLRHEFETERKMQADIKKYLLKQRADFEEAARLKQEEEELRARQRKNEDSDKAQKGADKNAKPKKPPREPQIIPPGYVPVVRQDFLDMDLLNYREEMLRYHPNSFGLYRGEINLRKFQILGGVYQLNCVSKPTTTKFPRIIMTWFSANERVQYKITDSIFGEQKPEDVSKFFEITFELPEYFCYWGEPIPCLFEAGTSFKDSAAEQVDVRDQLKVSTPIIINDFNLHELFDKRMMYNFIEHTIPRTISSFKFPDDLRDEDEEKKAKATLGRTKISAAEQERQRELALQKQRLSFNNQYCPERLFPLFKRCIPITILPMDEEFHKQMHPYEHFSQFLSAVEQVKKSYQTSTFRDKKGNEIKILAEKYDRNIRRPKIIKLTALEETGEGEAPAAVGSQEKLGSTTSLVEGEEAAKSDTQEQAKSEGKSKKGKKGKTKVVEEEEEVVQEEVELEHPWFSKWSTSNILKSEFNASKRTVTIWTDRLGTFGFAFYRYQHFPFQSWMVQPSEDHPGEVEVLVTSMYAAFRIYVSANGYKACVSDFTKYYKNRKMYFELTEAEPDLEILKWKLQQRYLNIFPERDASWYITGYFCEKHLAAEFHTYNCLGLYSTALKFGCSFWNKLSNRRIMVLKFGELRDDESDMFLLRITPEDVTFVDIKEVCTDLEVIELEYTPTWRNLEWYPDLNHLIRSNFSNSDEMRITCPTTLYYLKNVLQAIRPLSCS